MSDTSLQPANSVEDIIHNYGDMLFRLCLVTLGNSHDAEDAIQETFIRYFKKAPEFKNAEHEKAWLITVATNKCKDILRFRKVYPQENIDDITEYINDTYENDVIEALMTLPHKFKIVLVLYYIEGYKTKEIASIIHKTPSAVKMRLKKARRLLKEAYGEEIM